MTSYSAFPLPPHDTNHSSYHEWSPMPFHTNASFNQTSSARPFPPFPTPSPPPDGGFASPSATTHQSTSGPQPMDLDEDHSTDANDVEEQPIGGINQHIEAALTALRLGDWSTSLRQCREATQSFHTSMSLTEKLLFWIIRAEAFYMKGDYDGLKRASSFCKSVIRNLPPVVEPEVRVIVGCISFRRLAEIHIRQGDGGSAEEAFGRVMIYVDRFNTLPDPFANPLLIRFVELFVEAKQAAAAALPQYRH